MALKPCRECKKPVSTEALACPHCGVPTPVATTPEPAKASAKDTVTGLVILVGIVVAAVTMCGPGSEEEKKAKAPVETEQERLEKAAAAAAKEAQCRKDLQCIGNQLTLTAAGVCVTPIERLAKYSMRWTDGMLEPKFSHFRWRDKKQDVVTVLGDKAEFQNGFGAYSTVVYECDLDVGSKSPLSVRVKEGRI